MKVRLNAYISKRTYDYMKRVATEQRMTLGEVTESGITALQTLKRIADLLTPEQKKQLMNSLSKKMSK